MDIPVILVGILSAAALLLPALDIALRRASRTFSAYFATFVIAISLGIVLLSAAGVIPLTESVAPNLMGNDLMGLFFSMVVLSVALLVSASSIYYMKNEHNLSIYYSLLLFTSLGMVILSFAVDFLMIFV